MLHDFHAKNPTRKWNHICPNVPVHMIADWASEVVKFCRGQLEITSPCHEAEHLLSGKKNVIPIEPGFEPRDGKINLADAMSRVFANIYATMLWILQIIVSN